MARKQDKARREPLLEWIAAGLGLAFTLGMLAVIGFKALVRDTATPPAIEVRVEGVVPSPAGYVVEIAATNRSGATAAAVQIEGELTSGEASVETSTATFDYVPGHAVRKGGLFFRQDPRRHRLEVRALGYQAP